MVNVNIKTSDGRERELSGDSAISIVTRYIDDNRSNNDISMDGDISPDWVINNLSLLTEDIINATCKRRDIEGIVLKTAFLVDLFHRDPEFIGAVSIALDVVGDK